MKDIIDLALSYVGNPVARYNPDNANSPESFNGCSGFVQFVDIEAGLALPTSLTTGETIRRSEEFFDFFGVFVDQSLAQRGDHFFTSSDGVRPTHIGFYLGEGFLPEFDIVHGCPKRDGTGVVKTGILDVLRAKGVRYRPEEGFPQIYSERVIGFKRPTILTPGERYQKLVGLLD